MYFLLRERWFHLQIDIVAAKARHESAFRHWQTAATAAPVRLQSHARGEAEVFGEARPRDGATAFSTLCRNRC